MEEYVGQLWHKLVTRASRCEYPEATVTLEEVRRPAAMLFRALGGDGGLRLEAATESEHGARRSLLSRIAGSNAQVELAWRDDDTLRLPMHIAWYPQRELNRELYLWLAALAAHSPITASNDNQSWLLRNARATNTLCRQYPGLAGRYQRLLTAHLKLRPNPAELPAAEAAQEEAIRQALLNPAGASIEPASSGDSRYRPAPVILWLHPQPPIPQKTVLPASKQEDDDENRSGDSKEVETDKRRRGEYVDEPDGKGGLLAFRLESLFTRAEYVAVDRTQEENEDEDAKACIEDLEVLSMSRDRNRSASRLRFDLDLPSEEHDDIRLGDGIPLPEWDYKRQSLIADHCRLQEMLAKDITELELPTHLQRKARRLRSMFEMLKPRRVWHDQQADGSELDTNALIRHATDKLQGSASSEAGLYRNFRNTERDLSCLVLADLSLSTDAHVDNEQRVIDVIRDSLHLFAEALQGTGDRFALYGFSSRHRDHVRYHKLKSFDEAHNGEIRGRINAIKPGYYTRMGAAIRHSSKLLQAEPTTQKLLLILTDGKPNDLDKYEGRYGVEDTRQAVREATAMGIQPFCVTIDKKAGDYLPYLFGSTSYVLVRDARELPKKLPALYARLTS
jgi:nitric oxide reductase NorD protein